MHILEHKAFEVTGAIFGSVTGSVVMFLKTGMYFDLFWACLTALLTGAFGVLGARLMKRLTRKKEEQ